MIPGEFLGVKILLKKKLFFSESSKVFEKMLENGQVNPQYAVGNSLTWADLDLVGWYIQSKDVYFGFDFEKSLPVSNRIVMGLLKNPKIAKYVEDYEKSGFPFTGMGILY